MSLHLDPIWPYPIVAAMMAALAAIVWTTYRPRVRHLSPVWRRSLVSLRLLTAAVLVVAMLRPEVRTEEDDDRTHLLVLLADMSRSMSARDRDAAGGVSRREAVLRTLDKVEELRERLQEKKIDLRIYDFADAIAPVTEPTADTPGEQTAIGAAIEAVLRDVNRDELLGMLLLSDGAQRALPPLDADPRRVAQQVADHPSHRVPISTVVYGSSVLDGAADVLVEEIVIPRESFVKTTVPITGRIRATGAAGRTLTVRLLLEDRSGKQFGETGELQPLPATRNAEPVLQITPKENSEVIPFSLSFVPQQPGDFLLAVQVEPMDGEVKTENNQKIGLISVRKGGVKIAYFDKVYWEQKHIRRAGQSEKIDIDFIAVRPFPFLDRNQIDKELFSPDREVKYDAYIIGDVPASVFGEENLRELAARVDEGAGLMMLGGFHSFGPGGYAGTPLERLLPVRMQAADEVSPGSVNRLQHYLEDLKVFPTRTGLSHFIMQLASATENTKTWDALPPLRSANKLEPKNAAVDVLAATDRNYPRGGTPLLLSHEVGQARVIAFAGDTTFQWVMHGHATEHQRFWRQMLLYLSRKELDGDQPVWVVARPRTILANQDVGLEFGARDAKGKPIDDAAFAVEVLRPDGNTAPAAARSDGSTHTATFNSTALPGGYWVKVSATKDGASVGPDGGTRFLVEQRDLELDNLAADPDLMKEIAGITGGRFLKPEEIEAYLTELLENPPTSLRARFTATKLWDNWWFLSVFVALMTIEWFLRKRQGLV